jgi:hypothetical protein
MRCQKIIQLSVLFAVATTLLADTAGAAPWVKLTPTGVEPTASGEARFGKLTLLYSYWDPSVPGSTAYIYGGDVSVKCFGLTPGAAYTVRVVASGGGGQWPFTADTSGTATSTGQIQVTRYYKSPKLGYAQVGVYRDDGTCVLSGSVSQ